MSRLIQLFSIAAATALVLLLTVPLLALLLRVIQTRAWESAPDAGVMEAITLTFLTTTITSLLTIAMGTPLAYGMARATFRFKRVLSILLELPIVLPPAVAGLTLLIAFGRRGLLGPLLDEMNIHLPFTTAAVIVAQIFVSAPFYIRAAQTAFRVVDVDIENAARVDGANAWELFRRITFPLARRNLAAGLALSWARALGEFGATMIFAGSLQGRTQTMPLLVYNVLEQDLNGALWTGLLLVVLALGALLLSQLLSRHANET
jgi:molybdate transport system permease protein